MNNKLICSSNSVLLLLFYFLFFLPVASSESISDLNGDHALDVISNGFKNLENGDPQSAVEVWIKGSAVENAKDIPRRIEQLNTLSIYYGRCLTIDVYKRTDYSDKVAQVYVIANYERGPIFFRFLVFSVNKAGDTRNTWVVPFFDFATIGDGWPDSEKK